MKLTTILSVALASSSLLFTACDKKAEGGAASGSSSSSSSSGGGATSEKDALEAFKKQAAEIKDFADKNKPDGANPAAGMALIGQMVDKMKALKTDGLPADLKQAVADMNVALGKMNDVIKDLPKDAEGFQKAIMEKATKDPAFVQKFQTDMAKIGEEVKTAGEKLKEASKKHGIDFDIDQK